MERQQFIDNELENYIKQFPDATDAELDDILKSASTTFDSQNQPQITSTPMPEPQVQPQAEENGVTMADVRQALKPPVEPDLSLFQRFAGGPVGDVLTGIGNIARQSQTVSPEALAVAQQQTVIPTKEEALAQIVNNAQAGAQAIRNVPTAVGGLAGMIPSFATDIARGATDIMAGGAEMLGADQIGRRIREEGKLAADTAKQLAAESTANIRQFYEGKPTDVEGEMLAEELQPSKKQGALAKAMTTKFLWDAENMPPDAFKAKYPEALPIDTFNAKFEEVLRGQSLPQTVKSFFFDMPLESVKTIYGAIAGDPEVRQRFIERPAETIVETGVGLGIGIKGGKELYKATKDIAKKATVFERPQDINEKAESDMANLRAETDFLRKNTEQRDAMREQSEAMTGAPNRGMSAEELASTMRNPTVTIGEAERLRGEAIPEGKGMTIRPTAPTNKLDQLFKREPKKAEPKTYRSNISEDMTTEELYNEYEKVKQEEKINDKKILGDKYNQWRRGDSDVKERIEAELGLTEEQKNQLYGIGLPETTKTSGELNEMFESAQQPNFASTPQELGMLVANSLIKSNNLKGKPFGQMTTAEQGHYLAVKNAFRIMQEKGWNAKDVINSAAQKIARDTGGAHNVPDLLSNFIKREPSKPSPEPQQATEVVPKDITPQPVEQTPVKTPEVEPRPKSGPGMFGGTTVQNMYEEVAPTLKKGADMLFKKGKPVETEAPLRQGPRFIGNKPTQKGAFNPSSVIDAISSVVGGKKRERPFEVTIGDPALAKEFEKTFKATQAAETAKKQTAKAREQSTMSAYKQGLVDLFSPIIDRVPKGPEREKVMSIVHDIFYLGSPAEAFMRKTKDIVLDKVKHEDYASYMAAKAITTFREHIEKPDRIKLAEDFLKSIDPKTIKDYEKITNEWHEKAWKPILEELKASGLGDPLIINNIMGNENYAPFFPAKQLGLPHGIGENAPGAGIYKLKGGMGDYMDVLAAKMKKGIAMIAAAKINQGKLAAIDSMLQYDKSNIKEAIPEYKGFYKERDPLTGKMLEIPIVEFPEPQPGSGLALMEVRRDGKKVGYYVPKEITRAFDMAMGEGDTLGATMRGFQKMTQGFRNVWIEYNPIWQVAVNAPRDIMAATIEMPKIGNKFKFMGNLAKVAPAAVGDYVPVLGKVVQAFTGYDRKKFEKDVTKALGESKLMSTREPQYLGETDTTVGEGLKRAYGLTEKHTGIAKALDTVQEFGKDIERMTKIAADLTLEGDKRFTDPEIKNIVRQIGSPAFPVRGGGDLFKTIKTATMFYNATKQSWVAAKYFLEKDPVGAIAFASVPMGLYAATIAAENGVFGDDMEKAYTLMKGYDKENKLNFPIGYKDNGEVEYISLPLPQFLKPVMRIMRTAAKENPKFLDSIIKGFSEELPMLNPVVGLINRITSYGDEKPPAAELSGQEITTQDQWDAGGSIKGSAFLKAFWNDYLLGSQIRLKVKPSERELTWGEQAFRFIFGKVYKTNFNEDLDTSATRQKQALQRLKTREAAEAKTPEEQQRLIKDMVKEGYTPQKGTFKSAKQQQVIETLRKTNAPAARQMEIYLSGKSKEEKVKAFQKLNDLLKKKKK